MAFGFSIPTPAGPLGISVEAGSSVIFVGANGGGKTRLAAYMEEIHNLNAHRIAAHRSLTLNPTVAKINEQIALAGLRTGYANSDSQIVHRRGSRWGGKSAVSLLNDFDFLIQVLFADQAKKSLVTHKKARAGISGQPEPTKFERLVEIWDRLLPHRELDISGDDIQASAPQAGAPYNSSDMSDGERAIFYLIGQTLAAAENSLLIFDEPELHIHRSIIGKLWDELEASRPDCAFVFITHDLEFAASRAAQKFIVRNYEPTPYWTIESVPEDTGFDEELTTLILGSRRPILFVEGCEKSLDLAIYRCCYPDWTVIPRGSCEEVIHSVVTLRRNKEFTRVTSSGIVDADDHSAEDVEYLGKLGIAVLTVSEIENVILLPTVSRAIAEHEGYQGAELTARLTSLERAIFETLDPQGALDGVVARYCRRQIDRLLKKIDLSEAMTVAEIADEYTRRTGALNIPGIANKASDRLLAAMAGGDLPALLAYYDNKGLLALAAAYLKKTRLSDFDGWLTRVLRNGTVPALTAAIRNCLPQVRPL